MSLILRHNPQKAGLQLDEQGWIDVEELLTALKAHGHRIDKGVLRDLVAANDKQRFAFSDCQRKIRNWRPDDVVNYLARRTGA